MKLHRLLGCVFIYLCYCLEQSLSESSGGTCGEGLLPCDSGECIPRKGWCDKKTDCADKSDQAYCKEKSYWDVFSTSKCKDIHFECGNGVCFPTAAKCDGNIDCKDKSDEYSFNCETKTDDPDTEAPGWSISWSNQSEFGKSASEVEVTSTQVSAISTSILTALLPKNPTTPNFYTSDVDSELVSPNQDSFTPSLPTAKTGEPYISSSTTTASYSSLSSSRYWHHTTPARNRPPISPTHSNSQSHYPIQHRATQATFPRSYVTPTYQHRPYFTNQGILPQYPSSTLPQKYSRPTRPSQRRSQSQHYPPTRPNLAPNQYPQLSSGSASERRNPQDLTLRRPLPSQYVLNNQDYWGGGYDQYPRSQQLVNSRQQPYSNGERMRATKTFSRQRKVPKPFFFEKNYVHIYGRNNTLLLSDGYEWILRMRNSSDGWGRETPRALIALSLVNNSLSTGSHENDLMQKYLSVYLGTNLFKKSQNLNRLSQYVHSLLATCLDPRDFHGLDLTELIRSSMLEFHRSRRDGVVHPIVYLSLCLADRELTHFEVHDLMTKLATQTTGGEQQRDMLSYAIMAFACHMQQDTSRDASHQSSLQTLLGNATTQLLRNMKTDGSFGSIYGTALAAQALISVNDPRGWKPDQTLNYLKQHQKEDGSYGDFLATYLTLPVLAGRSLLHLRNTQCRNTIANSTDLSASEILEFSGQKILVQYSLYFGHPVEKTYSIQLLVPQGISFFDVMRVAADQNSYFKFSSEVKGGSVYIYSISNMPNDSERGLAWHLYIKPDLNRVPKHPNSQEIHTGDIKEYLPRPEQHFIFWYHPTNLY